MGTTPLRSFLQSLCNNSCWKYAVFWKLQQQNQMLLICEDGYFDALKEQDSMEKLLADTSFEDLKEMSSSSTYHHGALGEDAVELAMAYLSSIQYALGEGVVGDVACTGNHRWVFSEAKSSDGFSATLFPEHADEWLFQFAAGVKTILLVPVLPHGVLQLGSLETLYEDAAVAAYIKDEFIAHQNFMGYSEVFEMNKQLLAESPSSLMSTMMKSLDEFPSILMNGMCSDDSTAIDNLKCTNHKPLTKSLLTPPCDLRSSSHLAGTDSTEADCSARFGVNELPADLSKLGNIEGSKPRYLEEKVPAVSYCNSSSMGALGEYADRPFWSEIPTIQPLVNDIGPVLSFPKECELHKALGPAFMTKTNDSFLDLSMGDDIYSSSALSARKTNGYEDNMENLLGDVVTSVHLGENSSTQIRSGSLPTSSFVHFGKHLNENSVFGGESSLSRSHVESTYLSRGVNLTESSSPSAISYEGVISELIEEREQTCWNDSPQLRKGSKPSVGGKRRGKSGVKPKPRPRDRQLIQDRLKELREHVPDGAKCSIDGLLDRTIKHMLFLKSVGDRADKLRRCAQLEASDCLKTTRTPDHKGSSQNGASWAFEFEGDKKICPIIVEDLQYPGHMIIEMICDESSRFFEIAEVIHGLDLTILKGVTERRSGNTWAHFVIEGPRGFHRLDIFWPLMKLLQQQHNSISSKI